MAHYALVDENNQVVTVIVSNVDPGELAFLAKMASDIEGRWIQTSYNTREGVHYGQDGRPDGGVALRKNYAGIGYTYSDELDAFIPPKKYASWVLDETLFRWKPPIDYPSDGKPYEWNEDTVAWDELEPRVADTETSSMSVQDENPPAY